VAVGGDGAPLIRGLLRNDHGDASERRSVWICHYAVQFSTINLGKQKARREKKKNKQDISRELFHFEQNSCGDHEN
jgi:hypothetical protein